MQKMSVDKRGQQSLVKMRDEGFIPGVVYGAYEDSILIRLKQKNLERLTRENEHIISLDIEGNVTYAVSLEDVQRDPVSRRPIHVSFMRVDQKESVTMAIPVTLRGEAKGTKRGGIVFQPIDQVEVTAAPGDIPHDIEIDISDLNIGESLHLRDIKAPKGVSFQRSDLEKVLAVCNPPKLAEKVPVEQEKEEEVLPSLKAESTTGPVS